MNRRRPLTFAAGAVLALASLRADAQLASNPGPDAIIAAAIGGPAPSPVASSASSPINANLSSPSAVPAFNGTVVGGVLGTNASLNSPSTVPGFSGTLVGGPLGTNSNLSSPSTVPPFSGTVGSPAFVNELPEPGLTP